MGNLPKKLHTRLGELAATALCGNDILSSCLYVSGIAVLFSGVLAPFVLVLVALVLFFYKAVYTEVVEALPVNGGAYNGLLNGTSKIFASIAGVMTFLSYIATAVISAKVAVEYLHTFIPLPVVPATIVVLLGFALLVISGIKDSAKVAVGIFIFHLVSLSLFVVFGAIYAVHGHSYISLNLAHTFELITQYKSTYTVLFLAFSASLLGISGFESSANFVEEQKPGVFRKTLRNMLIGVGVFNPLIALVVINTLPYDAIVSAKDFLLAEVALGLGGLPFQMIIVADAFLVLSGAVLASYVGVSGLLHRMAADGCLPSFFTLQNKRGSFYVIILSFFVLCSSILIATGGDLLSLAGVYTIAFLSVMSLFALGNIILKQTRTELKRTYYAPLGVVVVAFFATVVGIVGNIYLDPKNLAYFMLYFIPVMVVVFAIIFQDHLLTFFLTLTKPFPVLHAFIRKDFDDLIDGRFVVFLHHPNRLFAVLEYINKNETGRRVTIIHCKEHEEEHADIEDCTQIKKLIPLLQTAGVFPHFVIDVRFYNRPFGPPVIDEVARDLHIHRNRILIGSIHHHHEFNYQDLGGARIIF